MTVPMVEEIRLIPISNLHGKDIQLDEIREDKIDFDRN